MGDQAERLREKLKYHQSDKQQSRWQSLVVKAE